jgi:ABC-type methionine transport system ATPase subunit
LHLTFPERLIQEPVVHTLGTRYGIVTNIRRANVEERFGWIILEVDGTDEAVEDGIEYLRELGVQVDQIDGDVVQG